MSWSIVFKVQPLSAFGKNATVQSVVDWIERSLRSAQEQAEREQQKFEERVIKDCISEAMRWNGEDALFADAMIREKRPFVDAVAAAISFIRSGGPEESADYVTKAREVWERVALNVEAIADSLLTDAGFQANSTCMVTNAQNQQRWKAKKHIFRLMGQTVPAIRAALAEVLLARTGVAL